MNTDRLDSTPNGVPPEQYGAFGEVMANMTPDDQATVSQIAARANSRVAALAGAAPKTPFYMSPAAFIVVGALVVSLATWIFWPSAEVSAIAVAEVEPNTEMVLPVVADDQTADESATDTAASTVLLGDLPTEVVGSGDAGDETPPFVGGTPIHSDRETTKPIDVVDPTEASATPTDPDVNPAEPKTGGPTNRYEPYTTDGIQFSDSDGGGDAYTLSRYSGTHQTLIVSAKVVSKMSDGDPMMQNEMPDYAGGDSGIEAYVRREVKQAMLSNPRLIGQTAMIMFKVSSKGKVSNVEIVSGDSNQVMQEVYRIFSKMPNWKKGSKKGKVNVMVAVTFEEPY
jgi:hypothetical protein